MIKNKKVKSIFAGILITGTLVTFLRNTSFYKIFIESIDMKDVKKVTEITEDNRQIPFAYISSNLDKDIKKYHIIKKTYENISFNEKDSSLTINLKFLNISNTSLKDVEFSLDVESIKNETFDLIGPFKKEILKPNETFEITATLKGDDLSNFKEFVELDEEKEVFSEQLEKSVNENDFIINHRYTYSGVEAIPINVAVFFDKELNKNTALVASKIELTDNKITHTDDKYYLLMESPELKIKRNKIEVKQIKAELDKTSNLIVTLTLKNVSNGKLENFNLDLSTLPYSDEHSLSVYNEGYYNESNDTPKTFIKDEISAGEEFKATIKISKKSIGKNFDYLTTKDYFDFLYLKFRNPELLADETIENQAEFSLNQFIKDRLFSLDYTYSYDTDSESIKVDSRYKPSSELETLNIDISNKE